MKTMNIFIRIAFLLAGIPFFMHCAAKKELASLKEEHLSQQQNFEQAQLRNESLNERITVLEGQISRLRAESSDLQGGLSEARSTIADLRQQVSNCPEAMVDGVVFKVQIGAFGERDIDPELDTSVNLEVDAEEDLDKMVVGQFREYYKADELQNQLRAMGVETAWIVPYRDGQRVSLKEVLPDVDVEP
jgi:hypothetical protein